ncbi:MAG: GNAT family N-acetyltransferase [Patescibacteria group bacterium]
MNIVKLTEEKFIDWNKFCLESNDAWFWHRADWIQYILNYNPKFKLENLSFLVYNGDKIAAIVPLILANNEGRKEFTYGGWPIQYPAFSNKLSNEKKEEMSKLIFNEIDRLALENNVAWSYFIQTPMAKIFLGSEYLPYNYLMKYGYINISINSQIIDLRKSEEELWDNLRRNHRRNIKKEKERDYKILIYTAEDITEEFFNNYKEMHHKAAGRKTRPDTTFTMMYNWIKDDLAFLVVALYQDKQIGFEYYTIYKDNVYGFSAANDPDFIDLPIRHLIEWEAILWMKKKKCNFYEIGWQHYSYQPYDFPDEKLVNISHFKKGFGGFTVPLFMSEKFYDKDYFLKVYQERMNKYAGAIKD